MTAPKPPTQIAPRTSDIYAITDISRFFALFDGNEFATEFMQTVNKLIAECGDHMATHDSAKDAKGELTLKITCAPQRSGDMAFSAKVTTKAPAKPPASGTAYVGDDGRMTMASPLLQRMMGTPRDIKTPHDPDTGEVRDY